MFPSLVSNTLMTSPSTDPFDLIPLLSVTFQDNGRTSETIKASLQLHLSWIAQDHTLNIPPLTKATNPQGMILDTIADSLRKISDFSDRY